MVITFSEIQCFEIFIDTFAYFVWSAEIHRGSFHFFLRTVRNSRLVGRQIVIRIDCQFVIIYRRITLAGEVEVGVIGQVQDGRFVCYRMVHDYDLIVIGKMISNRCIQFSGETFFTIGRRIFQLYRLAVDLVQIPDYGIEAFQTSMQAVRPVVDSQFIVHNTIQCEFSTCDTVAISSANSSEIRFFGYQVFVYRIVSCHYIG